MHMLLTQLPKMLGLLATIDSLPEEVIIENERGISVLGYPLFSSKLLVPQLDPPQFQLYNKLQNNLVSIVINRLNIVTSIEKIFPLNLNENNHNYHSTDNCKWFVLMDYNGTLDSDDQGWFYSWNFNNNRWKSKNGIVRRRIWIRMSSSNDYI
ncbi:hypothetical protein Kpol_1070p28 [Vanderwaltozyma polyspora DSM 70294]|uniref:Peroxin/Ferlin domain-containing protein n=1 Tax=Vanderwaltozyma polyspora (strain ATCC 22028 / DSM 70294 / BCRC 21397 / CBS 2163 / NBRC 10782 / NRRL Y-8283 / UCD 57-17) TaxID=436907 RepID=A7TNM8_VANPO|nr:uncharacterized protein Kpol_1070p28 [Vanderwaltozyma polyspora DSM 70294]EDO16145.1 hypothetical protein Kpol_1070p28 [Vanderwaltozyma polyspora DSM 70294]